MTGFDGDCVVVLSRAKKAKRRPEPATAATSKAIKTRWVLCCLALAGGCDAAGGDTWEGCAVTLVGAFVPGFGNKGLSGLLSAGAVKGVCLSVADDVNAEGNEMIGGGVDWNENGVKGAGVILSGWEGCSGL